MHVQIEQTKDVVLACSVYMPAGRRDLPSTSHAVHSHNMYIVRSHSGCACNAVMLFCTHECIYIRYMVTYSHTLQIEVWSPTGTMRFITIPSPHSQVKRYCYVYLLRVLHNLSATISWYWRLGYNQLRKSFLSTLM